jgi:hypothetical protein
MVKSQSMHNNVVYVLLALILAFGMYLVYLTVNKENAEKEEKIVYYRDYYPRRWWNYGLGHRWGWGGRHSGHGGGYHHMPPVIQPSPTSAPVSEPAQNNAVNSQAIDNIVQQLNNIVQEPIQIDESIIEQPALPVPTLI